MRKNGNFTGLLAIILWSTLAAFTVLTGNIPPFELVSISFFVSSLIGYVMLKKAKKNIRDLFLIPLKVWVVGVFGLFGYHFFYFFALKNAPALEANLINYLWPLFIVLFSAFLPNEKLKWHHILGSLLGLLAAVILLSKNGRFDFEWQYLYGYAFAFAAALTWSSYSVISKTFHDIPTYSVSGFCMLTSLLALACHLLFEESVYPSLVEFLAAIVLGLGPVGVAFYLWDHALKKGNIKLLGSLAYLIPLLSTLILVVFSFASVNDSILWACFLIVSGSLLSSKDLIKELIKNN